MRGKEPQAALPGDFTDGYFKKISLDDCSNGSCVSVHQTTPTSRDSSAGDVTPPTKNGKGHREATSTEVESGGTRPAAAESVNPWEVIQGTEQTTPWSGEMIIAFVLFLFDFCFLLISIVFELIQLKRIM